MKKETSILFVIMLLSAVTAIAQNKRRQAYDSLLVGDRITPAVSSVMMPKSYTEVILANTLLSTDAYYSTDRKELPINNRTSYFFNTLQITHGISRSGKFNIGLDLSYRTGRVDIDPKSSPLKVLGNSSKGLMDYDRAFTSIGLRTRYSPFANVPNLVVQHVLYIPINSGSVESIFLGDNRYALNTQFLYNQLLGRKMFLFGQADVFVRFEDTNNGTDTTVPVNIFATYLLNKHIFPFVQLGTSNSWGGEIRRQSYSYGAGLQYQFTTMLNINFFYNEVFAGKNSNPWKTFNLGIRGVF
jgi:hypothetical protein